MRQRRVLPGKFIQEDFISFTRALFYKRFGNEAAPFLLFLVPTIATKAVARLLVHLQVQIVPANGAEFHLVLYLDR